MVALLYSVDARLRLDLVGIEGPEGHTESLWYQCALADGAAQLGDTKLLTLLMRGFRT